MWDKITTLLSFTGVDDKSVWQDVIFSSFLIPIMIFLGIKLLKWWDKIRPSRLVFKDYIDNSYWTPHNNNQTTEIIDYETETIPLCYLCWFRGKF